ncbi:MAG: dienelactone hydrolase family protein [Myxococcota bacterium]
METRVESEVEVAAGGVTLRGDLVVPRRARGDVLFAHGSGSSRKSPRNRFVAGALHGVGLATLLMDLLSLREEAGEELGGMRRFDVELLTTRLGAAADWLAHHPETRGLPLALFGASTGAASALRLAADRPERVRAVVSRGGRPDLAGEALARVRCPVLLLVGGEDHVVRRLHADVVATLGPLATYVEVPGATHLFEEPGTLEEVARLAAEFLGRHV